MTMRTATQYTQSDSSQLRHEVRLGNLRPAGRRGGRGTYVFDRAELDRWMTGQPIEPQQQQPTRQPAAGGDDAIERIERLARGG